LAGLGLQAGRFQKIRSPGFTWIVWMRSSPIALDQELSKLHATGEWQKTLTENGLGPDADAPSKSPVQHCGEG
jgi:hypothetical protein